MAGLLIAATAAARQLRGGGAAIAASSAAAASSALAAAAAWQQQQQLQLPGRCKGRRAMTIISGPSTSYLKQQPQGSPPLPHAIAPVSVADLDALARRPTLEAVVASAALLRAQLPARLENHLARLRALGPPPLPAGDGAAAGGSSAALRQLAADVAASKARSLEVARDWRLLKTDDDLAALHHFESHLAQFGEALELEAGRLADAARAATEAPAWRWQRRGEVDWLNRFLDLCNWHMLSARVLLTQHSAALVALERGSSSSTSSSSNNSSSGSQGGGSSGSSGARVEHYHDGRGALPHTPPHQTLGAALADAAPGGLVARDAPLAPLLAGVVADCRAACREAHSAAPEVRVEFASPTDAAAAATLVVPFVEFVLSEVIKNALTAVVARYGAWAAEDAAPPVVVRVAELAGAAAPGSSAAPSSASAAAGQQQQQQSQQQQQQPLPAMVEITVTDLGHGIHDTAAQGMHDYFRSSGNPASGLLYGGGGSGGAAHAAAAFNGKGLGVPMARVYAAFCGGTITWETDSWRRHTTATLRMPKHGFTF